MNEDELNNVRQLIESMQSGLVELFDQLRELRERLNLTSNLSDDKSPSINPLFSEIVKATSKSESITEPDTSIISRISDEDTKENPISSPSSMAQDAFPTQDDELPPSGDITAVTAKVARVLDPIARELRTGEASADIILEYLQAAKDYLIDDDERKKIVAGDMDIVLNFLRARGKRAIRKEERDNILKRIRRWKAHLVSYSGSPAEKA